jgi:hypothetical protein
MEGPFYGGLEDLAYPTDAMATQANDATCYGVIYPQSRTRISSVTDRTSNTILFSEKANGLWPTSYVNDTGAQIYFTFWSSGGEPGVGMCSDLHHCLVVSLWNHDERRSVGRRVAGPLNPVVGRGRQHRCLLTVALPAQTPAAGPGGNSVVDNRIPFGEQASGLPLSGIQDACVTSP